MTRENDFFALLLGVVAATRNHVAARHL